MKVILIQVEPGAGGKEVVPDGTRDRMCHGGSSRRV